MDFRDLAKVPHKHFYSKHLVISGAGLAYGFARIRSVPLEPERAVDALVLVSVAGVGAGQAAQRQQPRHEAEIGVRLASRDQLVHLIEAGEAPPRRWGFAERLDRAGQIGDDFSDGNQAVSFRLHGPFSHAA